MMAGQPESTRDTPKALIYILNNYHQYNVTKRVTKTDCSASTLGGSSDVYKGKLYTKNGNSVDVAIKRVRSSLMGNEAFAKVC